VIARIEGVLLERTPTRVVVDVHGVGYEAAIPLSTFGQLPDEGKTVSLRIHTHVREDVLQLYGFATEAERSVFELLLRASRVGPKLAQTILSGIDADQLLRALCAGDVGALQSVPGVGAKTAARMVVELRERAAELTEAPRFPTPSGGAEGPERGLRAELVSALLNLQAPRGRAERVADQVLEALGEAAGIAELVRAALRRMAR